MRTGSPAEARRFTVSTTLPGDFVWRGKSMVIYFPLGTCLLLSVLFSLLSLLFRRR